MLNLAISFCSFWQVAGDLQFLFLKKVKINAFDIIQLYGPGALPCKKTLIKHRIKEYTLKHRNKHTALFRKTNVHYV